MDVIGYLASALVALPAVLGIARGFVAALIVVAVAVVLSRWTGVIVMAVASMALASSQAHAQTRMAEVTRQATAPGAEAPKPYRCTHDEPRDRDEEHTDPAARRRAA